MTPFRLAFATLSAFVLATGCGGPQPAPETGGSGDPTQTGPASPTPAIGPLKFFEGETQVVEVRSDSVAILLANNSHVGTFSADGSLKRPDGKVAKLLEDGAIEFDGNRLPFVVDATGGVTGPSDLTLTLGDDGTVTGYPGNKAIRIEGASSPQARRAAMMLLVLLSLPAAEPAADPAQAPPQ